MNGIDESAIKFVDPFAFIFTNAGGNVIFTDNTYLKITGDSSSRVIPGDSLQNILPLDSGFVTRMIEAIKQKNRLEQLDLPIRSIYGSMEESTCTGIAALDENGNFIGIDLILNNSRAAGQKSNPGSPFQTHSDVLRCYVEKVLNEGNLLKSRTFIQSYIVAQFDTIQILLSRIVGPAARQAFELITNHTAKSNAIPLFMKNGRLEFNQRNIDIQGYRNLLKTSVTYAVHVLGRQIVKREMLSVDKYIGSGTLDLITQMDLRVFLNG